MSSDLIAGFIVGLQVGLLLVFWCNESWSRLAKKQNDEWYNIAMRQHHEYYGYINPPTTVSNIENQ